MQSRRDPAGGGVGQCSSPGTDSFSFGVLNMRQCVQHRTCRVRRLSEGMGGVALLWGWRFTMEMMVEGGAE